MVEISNKESLNLQRLHHFAWKCHDIDETKAFYTGILGLPVTHIIKEDYVPSTAEYAPYTHIFFTMPDESSIAFFDLGDGKATETTCDPWVVHFAFKVQDEKELLLAKAKLEQNSIDVVGPTDHGFIRSIYFFDPNNLRLEITYDTGVNT